MSMELRDHPPSVGDEDWGQPDRLAATAIVATLAIGCLLVLAASPIARDIVAPLLPHRARVSSRGTNYGPFVEHGPTLLRRTGIVIVIAGLIAGAAQFVTRPHALLQRWAPGWWQQLPPAVAMVATGCWYGWLAHPHNAYPSNARFHWVDYLTWDSDNYFYAAGRLPHLLFYDSPFVWQAINATIIAGLLCALARHWELPPLTTTLITATPLIASNLLMFADTAEDVLLNTSLLLGAVLAAYKRNPVALGVMLAASVLGRPSFVVLLGVLPASEYAWALRRERSFVAAMQRLDVRYVVKAIATAVGLTIIAQLLFTALGRRYFLARGRIVDTGILENQTAIEVEGFTISAFSGVFALHALWVMPAVLLIGSMIAVWKAPSYPRHEEPAVYFVALAGIAVLALHESQPLNYYNVRYLTYVYPFLLVLAWHAFARARPTLAPAWRAGAISLLFLGVAVLPVDPIEVKRDVQARPETELLEIRGEVEDLGRGRPVAVTFGGKSTQNFMAYILRTNRAVIDVQQSAFEPGWLVVSQRQEPALDRPADIETDSILIWVATDSDV